MTQLHTFKRKIRFIINPFSGGKAKETIERRISLLLNTDIFDYEFRYTEFGGHAVILAQEAVHLNYDGVIAVGGDGTINEISHALIHSSTVLGIIPMGSGNGFSYHIGIGRSFKQAIETINNWQVTKIDTGRLNDKTFVNVAGIGMDAEVAYKTRKNKNRGFWPYFINTMKLAFGFTYLPLRIETDHSTYDDEFAMLAIANASYYGYNISIAPMASLQDGYFDLLIFKKVHVSRYFLLIYRIFRKNMHKSPLAIFEKTKKIVITPQDTIYYHLDGEGKKTAQKITITLDPLSLHVITRHNNL